MLEDSPPGSQHTLFDRTHSRTVLDDVNVKLMFTRILTHHVYRHWHLILTHHVYRHWLHGF